MTLDFDKKGFVYAIKLFSLFTAIFASFIFSGNQLENLFAPDSILESETLLSLPDNAFYIEPPGEKPVFFNKRDALKKRDALLWEKKSFLFVDLSAMNIALYENGVLKNSFPIISRADADSFFNVPTGLYSVQSKTENHISIINKVRFPWTIHLFENYVIHGWPLTLTGKKISSASTDGGIRLVTEDAKEIFAHTETKMPVIIANNENVYTPKPIYTRRTNLPHRVPQSGAAAVVVADIETGEILFEKNKNDVYPLASVSKLMTALLVKEYLNPEQTIQISAEAVRTYGDSASLVKGEEIKSNDLLYALLLPSSNDAAKAFEESISDFIKQMNEKARSLKLTKTFFEDSSGLSEENVASAADVFTLLQYIYTASPQILAITKEKEYRATSFNKKQRHIWRNINWPEGDKRFFGGKAGWTQESLQTMAGVYGIRVSEYGARPVAIITLGARDRIGDIRTIISYLEREFIYGDPPIKTTK